MAGISLCWTRAFLVQEALKTVHLPPLSQERFHTETVWNCFNNKLESIKKIYIILVCFDVQK